MVNTSSYEKTIEHQFDSFCKTVMRNFEVVSKLNGIVSFQPAKENLDSSPKNQFTVNFRKNEQPNSAIKVQ